MSSTVYKSDALRLESESRDINIEWSIEEFERFMRLKGWKYTIIKGRLEDVDSRCTILHTPLGIQSSKCLFKGIPDKNTDIIFSSSFMCIDNLVSSNEDITLNSIYFQYSKEFRNEQFTGTGLCNLIVNRCNLPKADILHNLFNKCTIYHLENSKTIYKRIYSCFVAFDIDEIKLRIHGDIRNSFVCSINKSRNIHINIEYVYPLADYLRVSMDSCFQDLRDTSINIYNRDKKSDQTLLIRGCFRKLDSCKVDISNLYRLVGMEDCFADIKNNLLGSTIDLSETAVSDIYRCFNSSEIDTLILPETIKYMINMTNKSRNMQWPKIVFTGHINTINNNMFYEYHGRVEVEYRTDTIKEIVLTTTELSELPKSLSRINCGYIKNAKYAEFNSDDFPCLKEPDSKQFKNCVALQRVILPNIDLMIGEQLFSGCYNLRTIVLGADIKVIGDSVFDSLNDNNTPVTIYTINNSETYRRLYNLIYESDRYTGYLIDLVGVNSLEEAIAASNTTCNNNSAEIKRYKFLLNNDTLFGDKYRNILNNDDALSMFPLLYKYNQYEGVSFTGQKYLSQFEVAELPDITCFNLPMKKDVINTIVKNSAWQDMYSKKGLTGEYREFIDAISYHIYNSVRKLILDIANIAENKLANVSSIVAHFMLQGSTTIFVKYKDCMIYKYKTRNDDYVISVRHNEVETILSSPYIHSDMFKVDSELYHRCGVLSIYNEINNHDRIGLRDNKQEKVFFCGGESNYNIIFANLVSNHLSHSQILIANESNIQIYYDIFTGKYWVGNMDVVNCGLKVGKKSDTLKEALGYWSSHTHKTSINLYSIQDGRDDE